MISCDQRGMTKRKYKAKQIKTALYDNKGFKLYDSTHFTSADEDISGGTLTHKLRYSPNITGTLPHRHLTIPCF